MADNNRLRAPRGMSKPAQLYFRDLVAMLGADAKEHDLSLYVDFANVSADVEKLTEDLANTGWTVETVAGCKTNPVATLLLTSRAQLAGLRRDLNLTPKARSEKKAGKVAVPFGGMMNGD